MNGEGRWQIRSSTMDPWWLVTVTIALHGGFSARIHPKSAGLLLKSCLVYSEILLKLGKV